MARSLVALGLSVVTLGSACGGSTSGGNDETTGGKSASSGGKVSTTGGAPTPTGGLPATGGRPSTGGASGTGAVAATGGVSIGGVPGFGGTSSGGAAQAGSGGGDAICSLPPETGPCNAAFESYYFDAELGACRPFTYGGCGGNANRFDTVADCQSACGGGKRCERSSECVVVPVSRCCAPCEPVTAAAFLALHSDDAAAKVVDCDVACAPCPAFEGVPATGNFFAECVETRCVLRDVRDTPLVECETDSDCSLRSGTGCCQRCNEELVVAVSDEASLIAALQCPEDLGCPPCFSEFPSYAAVCEDGQCRAERR